MDIKMGVEDFLKQKFLFTFKGIKYLKQA